MVGCAQFVDHCLHVWLLINKLKMFVAMIIIIKVHRPPQNNVYGHGYSSEFIAQLKAILICGTIITMEIVNYFVLYIY